MLTDIYFLKKHSKKEIYIWGTGKAGQDFYMICVLNQMKINGFLDISCQTDDTHCNEVTVYHPSILLKKNKDEIYVFVASMYYKEIKETLFGFGYYEFKHFVDVANDSNSHPIKYDYNARQYLETKILDIIPLFKTIEIETINRCNNDCAFCPVNKDYDTREFKMMSNELFDRILNQLKAIHYSGEIALFSNNEPFMDNRILKFLQKTRDMFPENRLYLFTNGTLLTLDKFKEAIRLLDRLIIDNYADDFQFIAPVKEIYEFCKNNPELQDKVRIILREKNIELTTRGGQAPNRNQVLIGGITCLLPFQQLIIRPDGNVSLCCNDALGKYSLGDLNNEQIEDIWYGEKYTDVRKKLLTGRENMDLCNGCDSCYGVSGDVYAIPYGGDKLLSVKY